MRKLTFVVIGFGVTIASCAPFEASNQLPESPAPTVLPAVPTETQEPTAPPSASPQMKEPTTNSTVQPLSDEDIVAPAPSGKDFQPQLGQVSIDLDEVVTLLPPDAIPAILPDRVPEIMVPAADADAAGIEGGVQVIGVSINGESRAYPIPFLSRHEIVNDTVGGRHIAATW
jgi:hypothetical protein